MAVAALHAFSGPADDPRWLTAAAPAAVMRVFLTAAAGYAYATRPATAGVRERRRR
ncbi:hypothetical protein ACFCYB_01935 [Streptomyces sp. NPDC056309]|uniref:hypothetical protein n=1 Tax=unclassified Streptomyces TaxID=2593676 RepID=UPI0035E1BA08